MCWKSEIITDIQNDKSDLYKDVKVGATVEYVENTAGELKLFRSKIKAIFDDQVLLCNNDFININIAALGIKENK
tara:strand:- start:742 stop:966 length:225 start_codon:yes stop_codon:yes gene_type:complete